MRLFFFFLLLLPLLLLGCSSENECSSYALDECPAACVVCPPCPECSSISCQTEEFCSGIGFNRSWYEAIQERLDGME